MTNGGGCHPEAKPRDLLLHWRPFNSRSLTAFGMTNGLLSSRGKAEGSASALTPVQQQVPHCVRDDKWGWLPSRGEAEGSASALAPVQQQVPHCVRDDKW